jgi:hypothetical protein
VVATAFCATTWGQAAQGTQAQGAQAQGPQWKDRGEYDLVQSIQKETDANKRLALLNQWKEKYAQTDFGKLRLGMYLQTYQGLNQIPNLIATANELVAMDPKDVQTLSALLVLGFQLNNTTPEMLAFMEKTAQSLIANIDNKPASVTEDQWKTQKNQTLALGHRGMGWVNQQRKNQPAMKEAYTKSLELNSAQGDLSYALGQSIIGEKDEKTYPIGLFHVARAAVYDGPGALPANDRANVDKYLAKAYAGFHGDPTGLDQVKATAKTTAVPPADFRILSVKEVHEGKEKQAQAEAQADPLGAMWKRIKEALTGAEGQQYFDSSMKDAQIPALRGYLVEQRPKELVLALSDKTTPEVTLQIDTAMPGKADPGTEITFEAVGKSFTKEPFMVVMETERKNIKGWPSAPVKKPAAAKKPAGAKRRR